MKISSWLENVIITSYINPNKLKPFVGTSLGKHPYIHIRETTNPLDNFGIHHGIE